MQKRILKVNELIKRELSKILLKDIEFPLETLVTITRVESTPDLQESRVFVSVLPSEKIIQVLKILNSQIYDIQQIINKRLKMRPIPKIRFLEERKTKEADRIEKVLKEIYAR